MRIERRQTARRRVCLGGEARVAAFLPSIDCVVRDVSLDGARIRVPSSATLPDRFDLFIPCRNETRRAWVAWRAGTAIGIRFTMPDDATRPRDDDGSEMTRLRAALLAGNSRAPGGVH